MFKKFQPILKLPIPFENLKITPPASVWPQKSKPLASCFNLQGTPDPPGSYLCSFALGDPPRPADLSYVGQSHSDGSDIWFAAGLPCSHHT